jgi:prepilin-type N-terminal cleavage/methylation domain-containing protein
MTSAQRKARGLTLLEVAMAMAILSLAITGTYMAWVNSQRLASLQREESLVQAAIQRYINMMRSLPFPQVDNAMWSGTNAYSKNQVYTGIYNPTEFDGTNYTDHGFSGGSYDASGSFRLRPGWIKLYLGWSGSGIPADATLRGVKVSKTNFPGATQVGNSYWAPMLGVAPEMRIIFINNEVPTEARMGEDYDGNIVGSGYKVSGPWVSASDGIDLNGDGRIDETPMVYNPTARQAFGDALAAPLFPRLLSVPVANPPRVPIDVYLNTSLQIAVYPVVIQVRWWSASGLPREITVITFLTNRAGSVTAAQDSSV